MCLVMLLAFYLCTNFAVEFRKNESVYQEHGTFSRGGSLALPLAHINCCSLAVEPVPIIDVINLESPISLALHSRWLHSFPNNSTLELI